jgi:hypothetical protein
MWGMVAEMEWKVIARRNKDRAAAYIAKHGFNSGAASMGKRAASKGGKLSGETRRKAIFDHSESDSVGAKYLRASSFLRTFLKAEPSSTLQQMAAAWNLSGFVTATGSVFHATSVVRLANRFDIPLIKNKAGRKKRAA